MSDKVLEHQETTPLSVYLMLILGLGSFAISPILIRLAQGEGVPSLVIAAARLVLAALILSPIVWQKHRDDILNLTRRDLFLAITAGLFLALHFASWVTSLEFTSVLISVVFVTSNSLWVALLEFFFLRTKLQRLVIVGLVIAVIGGLLIGFGGASEGIGAVEVDRQREFIGGGLSLIGAITFAIYLIIGRNLQQERSRRDGQTGKLPLIAYLWLVYGSAGLMLLVWVLSQGIPITGYSTQGYFWLVLMALLPQLIGHSSLNYAVRYIPATLVSMFTQLEPIGSATIAYFLFDELPLPLQLLGSAIIIIGVMLANYGQTQAKAKRKVQ